MAHIMYLVDNGRLLLRSAKAFAKNGGTVIGAVTGENFRRVSIDAKGNIKVEETYAFERKEIPTDAVMDADGNLRTDEDRFQWDAERGILTLPSGERGRSATEGANQQALDAAILAASNARKAAKNPVENPAS